MNRSRDHVTYVFTDWRVVRRDARALVYKPGIKTFLKRLVMSLFAGVIIAALMGTFPYGKLSLDPRSWLETTALAVICIVGTAGLLAPLSCIWQRLDIERDCGAGLRVHWQGVLMPTTRSWPNRAFSDISLAALEQRTTRRAGRRLIGYQWFVSLVSSGQGPRIEFCPHLDRVAPAPGERLPERVETLVSALEAFANVHCDRVPSLGNAKRVSSRVVVSAGGPRTTCQVFRSPEEIPEHLRERINAMAERAREVGTSFLVESETSESFTVTGPDGITRTYKSLEEMPPDVRKKIEEVRRSLPKR